MRENKVAGDARPTLAAQWRHRAFLAAGGGGDGIIRCGGDPRGEVPAWSGAGGGGDGGVGEGGEG